MLDILYIGPTPADEACAQTGVTEGAERLNKLECSYYIEALRKVYGPEPENAYLSIKRESHDFGTYFEVVCRFDDTDQAAVDYAYKVEDGLTLWSEAEMEAPVKYDSKSQPVAQFEQAAPFQDVSTVTEYGLNQKLSNAVRVF